MAAGGPPPTPPRAGAPGQIFISYRRADSAGFARAVADALAQGFGEQRVFIDVDDIAAGQPFADVITQAMGSSAVLLVVIGPGWLARRPDGSSRLDDPADLVRQELATGLAAGLRVIPLLVDGAAMPGAAQLPEPLRTLAGRHAVELRHGHFGADMQRLMASLRQGFGEPPTAPAGSAATQPPGAVTPARLAIGMGLLLALAGAGWWAAWPDRQGNTGRTASTASTASAAAARVAINGRWTAQVRYDWPNADYEERFEFSGQGAQLQGTASFLQVPRGLQDGLVQADRISFVTRTGELSGSGQAERTLEHRYQGHLVGDRLELVMMTSGGSSSHAPVQVVASRTPPPLLPPR